MSRSDRSPSAPVVAPDECGFDAWNPGISSEVPRDLLPLSSLFRPENVFTTVETAYERQGFTGLELQEVVVFRPERLVIHELLLRITADLSVPAGERVEDLGINFRHMADRIRVGWIEPAMPRLVAAYDEARHELECVVGAELERTLFAPPAPEVKATFFSRLTSWFRRASPEPVMEDAVEREERIRREWSQYAQADGDPLNRAAYRALARAISAMRIRHGRAWADKSMLVRMVVDLAANDYGSEMLGGLIAPLIAQATVVEGYVQLPLQSQPVVLNTKGASASGKSTLRPLQSELVARLGASWADFALISPDIWRKYLLDYGTLGDASKYAGSLTGVELEIIDRKLDRYMARKAEEGRITHLLIDRFRFDSFAFDTAGASSNLLTRFGHLIYMFFLITAPHETVERAWRRGREVGRYKSVDDLLAHNVEAYAGMSEMFFTWALRTGRSLHYEFLDNNVPLGEKPLTVAFGLNGDMNILHVKSMLDIERYRKINIHAQAPDEVYPPAEGMRPENNTAFLVQCVRRLPRVNFVDRASDSVYARFENGALMWVVPDVLEQACRDDETRTGLLALAPRVLERAPVDLAAAERELEHVHSVRFHTLGR